MKVRKICKALGYKCKKESKQERKLKRKERKQASN